MGNPGKELIRLRREKREAENALAAKRKAIREAEEPARRATGRG